MRIKDGVQLFCNGAFFTERLQLLPARIRSMTGRYCFHRCLSVNISGGEYPISGLGGYPISGPGGGYSISGPGQVTPISGLGGGTTSQVWGGTSSQVKGGTPSQVRGGYPISGLGGTPSQVWGRGTPSQVWGGTHSTPPPELASTCYGYAAGGMPLAFTQEDCLVIHIGSEQEIQLDDAKIFHKIKIWTEFREIHILPPTITHVLR